MNQLILWPLLAPLLTIAFGYFLLRFTSLKSNILFFTMAILNFFPLAILLKPIIDGRIFVYNVGGWMFNQGIVLVMDRLSFFVLVLVQFYFLIALFWAYSSDLADKDRFFILLFLAQAGMGGLALTSDLFNMYVFLEIVSIVLYALVAYKRTAEGMEAGFKYIVLGSLGGFFVLWGIGLTYASLGNLNMAYLSGEFATLEPMVKIAILTFFTVGFSLKFAVFPLHAWKVDVMTAAPIPVNVILAGIASKIPIYCLLRIYSLLFGWDYLIEIGLVPLLVFCAVITIFVGHLMALRQENLKRLLAYSSVAHIGYITAGFATTLRPGVDGALFHALNHGLMKTGLFLITGAVIVVTGTEKIKDLKGLHRRQPVLTVSFFLLALGMIGLPPLNGFLSKWQMVMATMEAGFYVSALSIIFGGFIALVYYSRVISVFFAEPEVTHEEAEQPVLHMNLKLPVITVVIFCLLVFPLANFFQRIISSGTEVLFVTEPYISAVMGSF